MHIVVYDRQGTTVYSQSILTVINSALSRYTDTLFTGDLMLAFAFLGSSELLLAICYVHLTTFMSFL